MNIKPEIINVEPLKKINLRGIFLWCKIDLLINSNECEIKYTDPSKEDERTIELTII